MAPSHLFFYSVLSFYLSSYFSYFDMVIYTSFRPSACARDGRGQREQGVRDGDRQVCERGNLPDRPRREDGSSSVGCSCVVPGLVPSHRPDVERSESTVSLIDISALIHLSGADAVLVSLCFTSLRFRFCFVSFRRQSPTDAFFRSMQVGIISISIVLLSEKEETKRRQWDHSWPGLCILVHSLFLLYPFSSFFLFFIAATAVQAQ